MFKESIDMKNGSSSRFGRMCLAAVIFSLLATGCAENDLAPSHPVEVRFQLLNSAGEPTTSFHEGEDIVFEYRMLNKSDEAVFWFMEPENYQDLFTVLSIAAGRSKMIGTPHDNLKIYVNGVQMQRGSKLESHAEVVIRMTWKGDWDEAIFFGTPLGEPHEGHFT
ncbi:hypothetical protein [Negadavirga shengliensis]|uniref:Lipoprotein n=1 Tax=Negadavirga shengliensis TaxID=1389218 RepID=A0ABV9SY02_9BACT